MALISISAAWLAGTFAGARFNIPLTFGFIGLLPFIFLIFRPKHRIVAILIAVSLITFVAAASYSYSRLHAVSDNNLRYYNGQPVTVTGMVTSDPQIGDRSTNIELSVASLILKSGQPPIPVKGSVMLIAPRYPAYHYGDVFTVTGKLETPPRLGDFDYEGYLADRGIYSTMLYPKIDVEPRNLGSPVMKWVYSLRHRLASALAATLPEPQASLAQGIVLGIRTSIPPEVNDAFIRTGTAHLLAISGLNLSIIAGILVSIGVWLFGRRHYIYVWLALCIIWLYSLLTGMNPPVVRGAVMASLFLFAELLGRQRSAGTALFFAAAIMVGISPHVLWNAAFQLSFLAMAGLIFLLPPLQSRAVETIKAHLGEEGLPSRLAIVTADSLCVTMAATVAVWPLVAYYFGVISFVGPLSTFLALPVVAPIIVLGILTGGIGIIAVPVAQVLGWVAWLFLSYMLLVVNGLALPASSTPVGPISPALIGGYYFFLAVLAFVSRRPPLMSAVKARLTSTAASASELLSRVPKKWTFPPLLTVAVLVFIIAATMPDDKLHVSFLDVGQGDAILIRIGNQEVLVDGGPSPEALNLALGRRMTFWNRTIEMVISTHTDSDHLAGLVNALGRFRVEQVLHADKTDETTGADYPPLYEEWRRLLTEKKVKVVSARAGQQISVGEDIRFEVLSPQMASTRPDIDNNGVVLRLSMGQVSFLFTADIGTETEHHLIEERTTASATRPASY